jgi:hypothetical protein
MTLWSIFWRTFAQLAAAALLAVQGVDFLAGDVVNNATALGLALLMAFIGAVIAVLYAFARSPAVSALDKALRSAAQALAGGLGALILNEAADLLALPKFLLGLAVTVVLAFAITYFQNQGPVPQETTTPTT